MEDTSSNADDYGRDDFEDDTREGYVDFKTVVAECRMLNDLSSSDDDDHDSSDSDWMDSCVGKCGRHRGGGDSGARGKCRGDGDSGRGGSGRGGRGRGGRGRGGRGRGGRGRGGRGRGGRGRGGRGRGGRGRGGRGRGGRGRGGRGRGGRGRGGGNGKGRSRGRGCVAVVDSDGGMESCGNSFNGRDMEVDTSGSEDDFGDVFLNDVLPDFPPPFPENEEVAPNQVNISQKSAQVPPKRNKGGNWEIGKPEIPLQRVGAVDIVREQPGPKGAAKNANTELDSFLLFIDPAMIDCIVHRKNTQMYRNRNVSERDDASTNDTNNEEIRVLFGLLLLHGLYWDIQQPCSDLWYETFSSRHIYRTCMSLKRKDWLMKNISFHNHDRNARMYYKHTAFVRSDETLKLLWFTSYGLLFRCLADAVDR